VFEYIGYVCASLAIVISLIGLIMALTLQSHVKNWSKKKPEYYPTLTIISPQRGKINPRNIDAIMGQNYPGVWEVIFATTQDDASLPQLQKYSKEHKNVKIAIADDVVQLAKKQGIHRCQKNNNLVTAIEASSPETEVYIFADADACPFSNWLSNLVAPLTDGNSRLGAITSARVYLPGKGLASWVQTLWILVSDLFYVGEYINLWGGGLAIPKAVFEKANLISQINGESGESITSHDNNINISLRQQGYEALFVPDCIVPRYPPNKKEKWLNVIRFTNRQVLQTWWSNKILWLYLLPLAIKTPVLLCALAFAWWYPLCLVALLSPLIDTAMGLITKYTLFSLAPKEEIILKLNLWVVFLPILTPLLVTINFISALFYRSMRWSGVEYTKRSVVGYSGDFSWRAK
jgi:cellulose synthase/poly-beta-1,6-N-acetylglucosamine synthase-like glycosyltransferase